MVRPVVDGSATWSVPLRRLTAYLYNVTVACDNGTRKHAAFVIGRDRSVTTRTDCLDAWQAQVARLTSPGMSEAVIMREFMRPGRERLRLVNLEQYRVSWHDERFNEMLNQVLEPLMDAFAASIPQASPAQARPAALTQIIRGVGPLVLSRLLPEA